MSNVFRSLSLVLVAAVVAAWAAPMLHAEDTGAKGSIKGVVYDADHKPLSGVTIHLFPAGDKPKKTPASASPVAAPSKLDDTPTTKPAHGKPLMETVTDANGAFTFTDVPAGSYGVYAMSKEVGKTHGKVTVTAGAAATVELTIKPHVKKPAALKFNCLSQRA